MLEGVWRADRFFKVLAFGTISGLLFGVFFYNFFVDWNFAFYFGLLLVMVFILPKKPKIIAIFLFCVLLGLTRSVFSWRNTPVYPSAYEREWIMKVDFEPEVRLSDVRYLVRSLDKDFFGRVQITLPLYPRFHYGDVLSFSCAFERPEPFVDNDSGQTVPYDRIMLARSVVSVCRPVEATLIESGKGIWRSVLNFKDALAESLGRLYPEPVSSLLAGVLYGYRGGLGELSETFRRSGILHIVAISGFNIVIVVAASFAFFAFLRFSPRRAFVFTAVAVGVFVFFTGATASVFRAGLMGILAILSPVIGRRANSPNILLLALMIMGLINPFALVYDPGLQLSFAATLGLMLAARPLQNLFAFLPDKLSLRENFSTTLSATLFTLPFSWWYFRSVAPFGIIANLLVLPFIAPFMALGALSLLAYFVSPTLGEYLAFLPYLIGRYIILVAEYAAFPK